MAARTARLIALLLFAVAILAIAVQTVRAVRRLMLPVPPLVENDTLRVGVDISYPPFGYAAGGDIDGIDVRIGRRLAEALGVGVQFVPLGFDGLYDALDTGLVDVVLAGLPADTGRLDRVIYTPPYFNAGQVLISPVGTGVTAMQAASGLRLAAAYGSEGHEAAEDWLRRIPPFDLRLYADEAAAVDAVRLGEADAAVVSHLAALIAHARHPDWDAAIREVTVVPIAGATRSDRARLAYAVGDALASLLSDGTIERIVGAAVQASVDAAPG